MTVESEASELPADVRRLSFRYGVPENRVWQLLNTISSSHTPQLGSLQNGDQRLADVERWLSIAGAGAWMRRVDAASGPEALFDKEFRFLAVSRAGRTLTPWEGAPVELPRTMFLGARYADLLPVRSSLLADEKPALDGLCDIGFFDGRILGARVALTFNFGFHYLDCVMDVWPVQTPDMGILAHSQLHPKTTGGKQRSARGVTVTDVTYF